MKPPARPATRIPTFRPPSRGGRPAGRTAGLTRDTILRAATREFAARGYDGAGVDRIAREAGVNKAMIYYHFRSKAGLYSAIIRAVLEPAGEQARAIAARRAAPEDKLDALVALVSARVFAHPELPPIMMREIAEGARHLDPQLLRAMSGLYQALAAIVAQGQRDGRFDAADPLLVYFTFVGPLIMFLGGAPVRRAMNRLDTTISWDRDPDVLRMHLQRVLRRLLLATGDQQAAPRRPRRSTPPEKRQ